MVQFGLENLRNRHSGKLCFIAGAGPSLRYLEPEDAEKHIMIAINSSIIKFPKAQYLFTCDPGLTILHAWQVLKGMKCHIIIGQPDGIKEGFGAYHNREGGDYKANIDPERFIRVYRRPDTNNLVFKPDDKKIVFGWSSAHCACHLAYLMGCRPIILVGCDCGKEQDKRYHYDFEGHEQYRDYVENPDNEKYFARETDILYSFVNYWNKIGSDNPNVEILNCSNAIIPNIQPAKLQDVLKKYGE
ncbi:MAG: hypothetical protein A2173_03790 [Planctomycetes bacterium RBG_13_44_8b]|nr:MAG: hypothetical protein A2173_03790 [Planctomycetes bacterium RBG_13_44_8b]